MLIHPGNYMIPKKIKILKYVSQVLIIFCFFSSNALFAQQYKFNHYSAENGLPQEYVYSIAQNKSGYLWLATSTGVIRFDGDAFQVFGVKNGLAEDFTTNLFVSSEGRMFAGHNQGGVSKFEFGKFKKIITTEAGFGSITGFDELSDHSVVTVGQSGKILVYHKNVDQVYDFSGDDMLVSAMSITQKDVLLLGTDAGLYTYKFRKHEPMLGSKKRIDGIPEEKIQCISKSKKTPNVFWIATSSGEIYKLTVNESNEFNAQLINSGSAKFISIQNIFEDNSGNLWVSTYEGVKKLSPSRQKNTYALEILYCQANGLPSDQVKVVFQDQDNNTWFGLYGAGLAMLKDEFFTFYEYKNANYSNNIQAILFDRNFKFFGSDQGFGCANCMILNQQETAPYENGLKSESITCLKSTFENILAGTEKSGVFSYNRSTGVWKNVFNAKQDNLANAITDIEVTEKYIWLGTRGGLYQLDHSFQTVKIFNTENGLAHNSINDIHVDRKGTLWVSSQSNMVATIKNGSVELVQVTGPSQSINITCIAQDKNYNLWFGTYGNGVFKQQGNQFVQISSMNNLASDYCYFLITGNDNDLWVGHRGALSRINALSQKITVFDNSDGIDKDFNELAAVKDGSGNLWFGSNNGIVKFDPKKYTINPPLPKINIKSMIISDKAVDISKAVDLKYGNYRVIINFIGIDFNNPEKVKYKYILKGFDLDWSEVAESNRAYYPKLSDGEYEFIVKACNEDGRFDKTAARIKIIVASPFWKKWWFILICLVFVTGVITFIIHLRERSQKKIRIYLEEQLQIRTHELVEQKGIVDQKNKDITDSINYAHKIQTGLLPSVHDIRKYIPQFFVMNKPRDIVSGDFYWYSVRDNIISIAVADCTGHGVPGAFMSAIGNLIFRKVNEYIETVDPALFISNVDEYLISLMNPDPESLTHDGMDMVLIMLDMNTGKVVFSGAKRPLVHFKKDGTHTIHKTCFESIGGASQSKVFTNFNLTLEKGDTLYMFSDGIVDQFGGENRRKIMTRGLTALLEESVHMDMQQQCEFMDKRFEEWKGSYNQIDDVLLMGIRY